MLLFLSIIIALDSSCGVSGLTLSVQTSYIEIGGSVTFECNLDGAAWNPSSLRQWNVPPNTLTVINGGTANTGYSEDLSDVATTGIFRMTTSSLNWSIENQLFQCVYSFDTASLNATSSTFARNSGSSLTYDNSAKSCVFAISEILPSPSKVINLLQSSGQVDISTDLSKVTETLTDNNDQGQTYSYRLEVASKDLCDGDKVVFQVTAGPYSMNETCTITGPPCDTTCIIICVVVIYVLGIVAVLIVLAIVKKFPHPCPRHQEYTGIGCRARCVIIATSLGMGIIVAVVILIVLGKEKKLPCQKGSQHKKPDSGNSGDKKIERPSKVDEKNTKPLSPATSALTNEAKPGGRALPPIPQHEKKKKTPRKKKKRVKTEDGEDTEKLPSIQKKERNIEHYTRDTQDPES